MSYSVSQPDIAAAEEPFLSIWRANLEVPGDARLQYRWHYLKNPGGTGSAFLLSCRDKHRDGGPEEAEKVVGCCGLSRRSFFVRGKPMVAALLGDFAVEQAHRTVLPAVLLQRAIQRHVKGRFFLSYGFPNASAVGIFRRIGYREISRTMRYARVLRHGPYLERKVKGTELAGAAGAAGRLLDGAARALQVLRTGPQLASRRLVWLDDVDDRFDELWERVCRDHPLLGTRGAGFLRWRFLEKPGERFRIAALLSRCPEALRAYAVVQEEGRVAHIRDLLGASEGEVGALLNRLVLSLQKRDLNSVSVRVLGAAWLRRTFLSCGFTRREDSRSVVVQIAEDADSALLLDSENWYLTDADEDV